MLCAMGLERAIQATNARVVAEAENVTYSAADVMELARCTSRDSNNDVS